MTVSSLGLALSDALHTLLPLDTEKVFLVFAFKVHLYTLVFDIKIYNL